MEAIVLAEKINEKLTECFNDDIDNFRHKYKYNTDFTCVFNYYLNFVLSDLGVTKYENENDYLSNKEYFQREKLTVDTIVWKSFSERKMEDVLVGDMWKYELLLEHENKGKTWLQELQKLCSIKSDNKIIVTYGRVASGNGKYETMVYKGVNLLDRARTIVLGTLSNVEKKIVELGKADRSLIGLLPQIVLLFGIEIAELEKRNRSNSVVNNLYDIYHFDYIQGKFIRVSNEEE